jgi:hypothetical protein
MRAQVVVSKERMRRFGKYEVKLVSKRRDRNTLPYTQAVLDKEGMKRGF